MPLPFLCVPAVSHMKGAALGPNEITSGQYEVGQQYIKKMSAIILKLCLPLFFLADGLCCDSGSSQGHTFYFLKLHNSPCCVGKLFQLALKRCFSIAFD